jgi:hypothetical protein
VKDASSDAWKSTKKKTGKACESSAKWAREHKKEIIIVGAAAAAVGIAVIAIKKGDISKVKVAKGAVGVAAVALGAKKYGSLADNANVGSGKPFTQSQKAKILQANMDKNNGTLRSDKSGIPLEQPKQYKSGYKPPKNEAQVDHIYPRSAGGTNSYGNAQVLSRPENLQKSDTVTKGK